MDIEKQFEFLVSDYGLKYSFQKFENSPYGNWYVNMYSFYNDSGCFSIHYIPQRGELDFYYAKEFNTNREKMCEIKLDEQSIGQKIWLKAKKKFLFGYRHNLYLKTLADAIKAEVQATGQFFGIEVET